MKNLLPKMELPDELVRIVDQCKSIRIPETRKELIDLAVGGDHSNYFEVAYDVPGKGHVVEATVARCRNGIVINYNDVYLRRRDPDCMVSADRNKTDKDRYREKYKRGFSSLRELTFNWLADQELILMPFMAGGEEYGYPALIVAPSRSEERRVGKECW